MKRVHLILFGVMIILAVSISPLAAQNTDPTPLRFSLTAVPGDRDSSPGQLIPTVDFIPGDLAEIGADIEVPPLEFQLEPGRALIRLEESINVDGVLALAWLVAIFWLSGLVILVPVGLVLSRLTLSALNNTRIPAASRASGRLVRVPYRLVIFLTVLYFYISSPILIFIALSIVLHINRTVFLDPVDLAVTVSSITIGFYIIRAIVQNAFISIRIREPNRLLLQFEAPTLWALTSEIAARVGTRSVDAIIIVPGPKIAISEQGELLTCLLGRGSRVLVLGFGILNGLNQAQLKALLAHDYGHFVNGETAGGHNALRLRTVLVQMKRSLIAANRDHPLNPAWLFVSFFTPLVARITLGAARHQELLADRVAARAYGRQNLIDGLRQVSTQENTFNLQVEREIEKAQDRKRHLDNLYQLPELDSREVAAADTSAMFLMNQTATVYDSHPAPNVRIELLQALVDEGEAQSTVAASVWRLLRNPEPLQLEMTGVVQQLVATHALHRTDSNVSASSRA